MKLATVRYRGKQAVGVLDLNRGCVWPLAELLAGSEPSCHGDMVQVIRRYDRLRDRITLHRSSGIDLREVEFEAPIPRPARNLFCVGKNYRDHAHEFANSGFDRSLSRPSDPTPDAPIVFTKLPESVIATGAAILYPDGISDSLDYEGELAVVIGRQGRAIARQRALEYVWGYTIINDITARDWQARHQQWFLGKSFDTFCPMGPWVATADELDPGGLRIRTWVNGQLRQDANTDDMIFGVPALIETISAGITLYPGDIIATGTPAGVGIGFVPPRYLRHGDEVAIEITGIGVLRNPVR